ncbi:hypothetical protein PV327_007075 [Microctonus hyperodae]|uniref:MD-2-related lipid-recognition domain-containing protein n=1 Tax=Microctonus hyperodae TaxID=165561 RepID=A0AA39KJ27_MICHY|nr:hypothetical protein PV327_007075 [Microctonus hyperodae]
MTVKQDDVFYIEVQLALLPLTSLLVSLIYQPVNRVTAAVSAEILGTPKELPFPNSDVCTDPNSGITCPLSDGNTFRYTYTQLIKKEYPKITSIGRWKLLDENERNIVCLEIPVVIR